jgi:hypothetical protein
VKTGQRQRSCITDMSMPVGYTTRPVTGYASRAHVCGDTLPSHVALGEREREREREREKLTEKTERKRDQTRKE